MYAECVCVGVCAHFSVSYFLIDPQLDLYGHSAFCLHSVFTFMDVLCAPSRICVYFGLDAEPGFAVDVIETVQAPPLTFLPPENCSGREDNG